MLRTAWYKFLSFPPLTTNIAMFVHSQSWLAQNIGWHHTPYILILWYRSMSLTIILSIIITMKCDYMKYYALLKKNLNGNNMWHFLVFSTQCGENFMQFMNSQITNNITSYFELLTLIIGKRFLIATCLKKVSCMYVYKCMYIQFILTI